MSSRTSEDELLGLLRSLRDATADERPSPDVEARLVDAFERQRPAPASASVAPRRIAPGWRSASRLPTTRGLAVAASVALVLAGAGAVRMWWPGRGDQATSAARLADRQPVSLAARALRPDIDHSAVSAPTRPSRSVRAAGSGGRAMSVPRGEVVEFVAWPGAAALPALESGELVRTELPASVIPLLGLQGEVRAGQTLVPADVIVGQDGRPRAVRLVSDER